MQTKTWFTMLRGMVGIVLLTATGWIVPTTLYAEGTSNSPEIEISPSSWSVTEGNSGYRTKDFTVEVSECPSAAPIKLRIKTLNGSAQSGSDFVGLNQTFTVANSASCQKTFTFTLKVKGDTNYEGDENFRLKIIDNGTDTNQQSYTFNRQQATITILNDDNNPYADVQVTKTNDASDHKKIGDIVTYTIIAKNNGPQSTTLFVRDELPNDVAFVSVSDNKSNFNCSYQSSNHLVICNGSRVFAAGQNVRITTQVRVTYNRDSIRNYAYAQSNDSPRKPDNDSGNNHDESSFRTDPYSLRVIKNVQRADGTWQGSRTLNVGDTVKFRLTVYNDNQHPTKVTLTDTLPSGLSLQSATVSGVSGFSCTTSGNTLTCTGNHKFKYITDYPSDKAIVTVTALAVNNGRYYNRARARGESGVRGSDRWSNSVRTDIGIPPGQEYIERFKTVTPPTSSDGNYYVGDTVTFTVRGITHGSTTRVRINDWLPPTGNGSHQGTTRGAFEYVSHSVGAGAPMNCVWHSHSDTNRNYIECISQNPLSDGQDFSVQITVRLKKAGHVCNRGYFDKEYELSGSTLWGWMGWAETCFDVLTPKQPPILNDQNFTETVDTPVNIDLKGYTTDPDSDVNNDLTYSITSGSLPPGLAMDSHGVITGTYTGSTGHFTFTVTVTDEAGLSDTAEITINFTYPPIKANLNYYKIPAGTSINGNLITEETTYDKPSGGTDVYPPDEGVDLNVTSVSYINSTLPDGNLTWQGDGSFSYTAPPSTGLIIYSYTITDKYGQTDSALLAIETYMPEIKATDDSYNVARNIAKDGNVITDNTGNGSDVGLDIKVVAHTDPSHGTLTIQPDGNFTYVPDTDYVGNDSFTYTIRDLIGQERNATVTLIVGQLHAEGYSDFYLVNPPETRNIIGNFLVTGNTVECLTDKTGSESDPFDGTCLNGPATLFNNQRMVKYIDIDGNGTVETARTWNSSKASFTLPNSYDDVTGNGILWAGLYWQGSVNNRAQTNVQRRAGYDYGSPYGYKYITSNEAIDIRDTGADKVLIKIDNGGYVEVEADAFYNDLAHQVYGINVGGYYAAFANITALLQSKNLAKGVHDVTVANIVTNEGVEKNIGNYGGWSLVVIYREDFIDGKLRNVSIYNGYQALGFGAGTYVPTKEFTISGFRLPQDTDKPVSAQVGFFAGEGERYYGGTAGVYDKAYISDTGSTNDINVTHPNNIFDGEISNVARPAGNFNDITNTNGVDIDVYDISSIMTDIRNANPGISSVTLGVESRDTDSNRAGTPSDRSDYVTLSMVAFSAELYRPKLCYDYSYSQDGVGFTDDNNGSQYPTIQTDNLYSLNPVTVELFIRNNEASDAILRDVTLDVYDINTSQARYHRGSVKVIYPKETALTPINDAVLSVDDAYIKHIPLHELGAKDRAFVNYDLDPNQLSLNLPINAKVSMTLDLLTGVTYPIDGYPLEAMGLCGDNRYDISTIIPGEFNVEDKGLSDPIHNNPHYFDLPTQVERRIGNFIVRAYKDSDPNYPVGVTTMVGIEVADMEKFHEARIPCDQPTNVISPRVWVPFANLIGSDTNTSFIDFNRSVIQAAIDDHRTSTFIHQESTPFTDASRFFDIARRAAAFRIIYPVDANSTLIEIEKLPNGKWKIKNFTQLVQNHPQCTAPVINPNAPSVLTDQTAVACSNDGNNLTLRDIAICMECLSYQATRHTCSRDMFAIRPKGFRINFYDEDGTSFQKIAANDAGYANKRIPIVTGYDYQIDINATTFDDNVSRGYYAKFDLGDDNRSFRFDWDENASRDVHCLNPYDDNQSITIRNSRRNSADINISDIGNYSLVMQDMDFTRVDWDPNYKPHQNANPFYLPGRDCVVANPSAHTNGSVVTPETLLSSFSANDIINTNGCTIASNVDGDANYIDLPFRSYPYKFAMSMSTSRGPNDKWFIYINTPPISLLDDYNMSYNIEGSYRPVGKNDQPVLNFTDGCWAEDTNLTFAFDYNSSIPVQTPYLSYALRVYDDNGTSIHPLPTAPTYFEQNLTTGATNDLNISQPASRYAKHMQSKVTMELKLNFDRTINIPLNPRKLTVHSFDVGYKNQPTTLYADLRSDHKITGTLAIDQNVTFAYGRVRPSQDFYDDITAASVVTPVYVEIYCNQGFTQCAAYDINTTAAQTDAFDWWLSLDHDGGSDGNVTLQIVPAEAHLSKTKLVFDANATENNLTVSRDPSVILPMDANITFDPTPNINSPWLIYNPDANIIPPIFYRVRFIGTGDWTGVGQTGHVVGDDINRKKIKRVEW